MIQSTPMATREGLKDSLNRHFVELLSVGTVVTLTTAVWLLIHSDKVQKDAVIREQTDILARMGLTQPNQLISLRKLPGFEASGEVGGSFFGANGNAKASSKTFVQIEWETKNPDGTPERIISDVPIEEVTFDLTPPDRQTVTFGFDANSIKNLAIITNLSEQAPPNVFVEQATTVSIDIPEAQFDDFIDGK